MFGDCGSIEGGFGEIRFWIGRSSHSHCGGVGRVHADVLEAAEPPGAGLSPQRSRGVWSIDIIR